MRTTCTHWLHHRRKSGAHPPRSFLRFLLPAPWPVRREGGCNLPSSHTGEEGQPYEDAAARSLTRIAAAKPLIHHITNPVVANDVANVTLAFGALPVMAEA